MILILSPAKTIDFSLSFNAEQANVPAFRKEADELAAKLKNYTTEQIADLMGVSSALALLNYERYQGWRKRDTPKKQALRYLRVRCIMV